MTATIYNKCLKFLNMRDDEAIPLYQLLFGSHVNRGAQANARPVVVLHINNLPIIHSPHWLLISNTYACFVSFADVYSVNWCSNVSDRFFDIPNVPLYQQMDSEGLYGLAIGNIGTGQDNGFLFDIVARLTTSEVRRIFDNINVGAVVGFDLPSVSITDPKPMPKLKRTRISDIRGTCWIDTQYPNNMVRTEYVHDFTQPWTVMGGVMIFSSTVIGSRILVIAKKVNVAPMRPIVKSKTEILTTRKSIEEVLSKEPFANLTTDTERISVFDRDDIVINYARELIEMGINTIAFVFPTTFPDYFYAFVEYVGGGYMVSAEVPRNLLVVGIKHATGMQRDVAGWNNLVLTIKASSSMLGIQASDPLQHSKLVMIIAAYCYIATIPFEQRAIGALLGVKSRVTRLRETLDSAFNHDPINDWTFTKVIVKGAGICAGLLLGFNLIKGFGRYLTNKTTIPTTKTLALVSSMFLSTHYKSAFSLSKFVMYGIGVATISAGYLYFMRQNKIVNKTQIEFHSVCPSVYFNNDDYDIKGEDHTNLTIDGRPFDVTNCECTAKLAAITKTFYLAKRPPLFPSQCLIALGLACITRMNIPRKIRNIDPRTLTQYALSLAKVHASDESESTVEGTVTLRLPEFRNYVAKFSGEKKKRLLRCHNELNLDPDKARREYFKREGFVKNEAYFKCGPHGIAKFKPRLIISYSPYYVAENGPLYHAYTTYLKNALSLENMVNLRRDVRYFMACGMTAEELGDWYSYAQERTKRSESRLKNDPTYHQRIGDNGPVSTVVIEMDQTAFDGNYHEDIKVVHDQYLPTLVNHQQAEWFKRIEEPVADQTFSKRIKNHDGSKNTLKFTRKGNHDSGKANTTANNSVRNLTPLDMAIEETIQLLQIPIYGDIIVLGDDNLIFLTGHVRSLQTFVQIYTRICEEISLTAKIIEHWPDADQPYLNNTPKASFCNGYFYPVIRGGEHRLLWAPKLSRVLGKLFLNKNLDIPYDDYLESILLAYRFCFPALPGFDVLWHRLRRDFHGQVREVELPWIRATEPNQPSPNAHVFMAALYDVCDLQELFTYFHNAPYGPLDHPLLDRVIEVDLGAEDTKYCTQIRVPIMGLTFNYERPLKLFHKLLYTARTRFLGPPKTRMIYIPTTLEDVHGNERLAPAAFPLSFTQPCSAVIHPAVGQILDSLNLDPATVEAIAPACSFCYEVGKNITCVLTMNDLIPLWIALPLTALKLLVCPYPVTLVLTWAFQCWTEEVVKSHPLGKWSLIVAEAFVYSHSITTFWFQMVMRILAHHTRFPFKKRWFLHLLNNLNAALVFTPNGPGFMLVEPGTSMTLPFSLVKTLVTGFYNAATTWSLHFGFMDGVKVLAAIYPVIDAVLTTCTQFENFTRAIFYPIDVLVRQQVEKHIL